MNLQVQNVTGDSNNKPKAIYNFVNWNQSSDRAVPSVSTYHTQDKQHVTVQEKWSQRCRCRY